MLHVKIYATFVGFFLQNGFPASFQVYEGFWYTSLKKYLLRLPIYLSEWLSVQGISFSISLRIRDYCFPLNWECFRIVRSGLVNKQLLRSCLGTWALVWTWLPAPTCPACLIHILWDGALSGEASASAHLAVTLSSFLTFSWGAACLSWHLMGPRCTDCRWEGV